MMLGQGHHGEKLLDWPAFRSLSRMFQHFAKVRTVTRKIQPRAVCIPRELQQGVILSPMKRCRRRSAAVPGSLCCHYGGVVNTRATEATIDKSDGGTVICHVTTARPPLATATCGES
jgi:hypothetical protein